MEIRQDGQEVGVIAVDPTSSFTGGAVLGDRVRMGRHFSDPGVFIRSMATRGVQGGLARTTGDAALILDAAGKDTIIIETVGVGQGEVEVAAAADVSVVVLVPTSGDAIQALKAGVMEIADIFVVNQSDRDGADRLVETIAASQALRAVGPAEWRPPILKTVATTGEGVPDLRTAISRFLAHPGKTRHCRARVRQACRLRELLSYQFLERLERVLPDGEGGSCHRPHYGARNRSLYRCRRTDGPGDERSRADAPPANMKAILDHVGIAVQGHRTGAGFLSRRARPGD